MPNAGEGQAMLSRGQRNLACSRLYLDLRVGMIPKTGAGGIMTQTVELAFEVDKTVQQALVLRAAKRGIRLSELVNEILQKTLAVEIGEVSGVPPLAALIQLHHSRVQESTRKQQLSMLK
jgi:hypothetical protein